MTEKQLVQFEPALPVRPPVRRRREATIATRPSLD